MAKKARSEETNAAGAAQGKETIAGYFRNVFKEHPRLLWERSNDKVFQRWLDDHPGHAEVPKDVRTGLQNIKSVLRKEKGGKKGKRQHAAEEVEAKPAARRVPVKSLEMLEEQIDEILALAKNTDRDALGDVIGLLRKARNAVVRLGGE